MFQKRGAGHDASEQNAPKRLRANICDLFLSNDLPGDRAMSLLQDARDSGLTVFNRIARGKGKKKSARDLTRRLLKGNKWPPKYIANVRVFNNKTQAEEVTQLPMNVPHELLHAILKKNSLDKVLESGGMTQSTRDHIAQAALKLNCPASDLLGIGLWIDGVPCNYDRTKSVEVFSMSFPGWKDKNKEFRVPLAVIHKHHTITTKTFDDIFDVIVWSLRSMANDTFPEARHDSLPWQQEDSFRKKHAKQPIGAKSILCEVRGDWKCYAECFRLPAWNRKTGCCWRCKATPADIRNCSSDANWRIDRLSHFELIQRILQEGKSLCPIFSAPFFHVRIFRIDWLHVADQGVTADFIGNSFAALLCKFPGSTAKERCSALFRRIQQFYVRDKVTSRLDNLYITMFATNKGFKLRSKAAECRALVPFVAEITAELMSAADPIENTIRFAAAHLHQCYVNLSGNAFNPQSLQENSRKFCCLAVSLEQTATKRKAWAVKPKLHLFQEMCELSSTDNPAMTWTYRDEDFGGTCQSLIRRRGGAATVISSGLQVLLRFAARHKVPLL